MANLVKAYATAFYIGDTIQIRDGLIIDKNYNGIECYDVMKELSNQTGIILYVDTESKHFKALGWWWSWSMVKLIKHGSYLDILNAKNEWLEDNDWADYEDQYDNDD